MVEMVAHRGLDEARRFEGGEAVLGLPLKTSSAVMSFAFLLPTSSPNARMPLVSAARSPASWVPPSGVGMVLQ
jgi:hypothetical protein